MSAIMLVGCGRMGGAMARGWAETHDVIVFDPHAPPLPGTRRVDRIDGADLPRELVVVLAVKPQMAAEVLPAVRPLAERGDLILSIMAGVKSATLGSTLGGTERIVRSMPNTPAAIGKGITAAFGGSAITAADRAMVDALLRSVGDVVWLESEDQLDAVTAISGSGPAYFFRFAEAMAQAGAAMGLDPELAMRLSRATFTGSAALADLDPASLAELRIRVTSPGGTTAAALAQFDKDEALDRLVRRAVDAAESRSRELSN